MEEKRQHPRIKTSVKSEVHSNEGMTFSTSADLSNGGIFISTPEPISVGSNIQLSIKIPDEDDIEINGIVRWMSDSNEKDDRNGMGIEFSTLSEEQKIQLKKILNKTK